MIQKIKFFFQFFLVCIPGIILYFLFTYFHAGEANLALRMYGRVSMIYLTLTLMISPLTVFISDRVFSTKLLGLRKLLGLASFFFFLIHSFQYVTMEYSYHSGLGFISYLFGNIIARPDALSGVVAGILMLVL